MVIFQYKIIIFQGQFPTTFSIEIPEIFGIYIAIRYRRQRCMHWVHLQHLRIVDSCVQAHGRPLRPVWVLVLDHESRSAVRKPELADQVVTTVLERSQ